MTPKEYDDIPGTYVFDGEQNRKGYHLNMFCMSLNKVENREQFAADPEGYLMTFPMTAEQRKAVLERDWLEMLRLGGNIYFTWKIAAFDRLSMQDIGAAMSHVSVEEFKQMLLDGGRPIDGNRSKSEWKNG
jgi:protocatechuate 4,5-dioxygenase, alpha chain